MSKIWARARHSVGVAAALGGSVTVLIVVIGMLHGSRLLSFRGGQQYDWIVLAIGYLCASLVGGMLVGVLQPVARTTLGAAVVGALVGTGFGAALHYAARPIEPWGTEQVIVTLIFALALGAPLGVSYRDIFGRKASRGSDVKHRAV